MTKTEHVVSLVMNAVEGDSRVIKTAKAAEQAGFRATIVGVGAVEQPTSGVIDGATVVLVPNAASKLKQQGLWGAKETRRLELLAEEHVRNVAPAVAALEPTILHSHDMIGLRVGAAVSRRLAANGRVVPWVHDLHEYVVGLTTIPEQFRLASMEYERLYLRQADQLITVSERLSGEVKRLYHLRLAPAVVLNAPELRKFSQEEPDLRSALGLGPDTKLVAYIGVAKKERGCETILRAVSSMPGVHVCFVSQGPYVEGLRGLASELGMGDRFHSVPYVESDRVTSFIRTADLGVHGLTHYPNAEVAMPNKLFEYLHAGLPVVVSDVQEMKRFVDHTGTGEVFKADNSISCAYALGRVLSNKDKYVSCITPDLVSTYSWQTQAAKLRDIYEGMVRSQADRSKRRLIIGDRLGEELMMVRDAAVALGQDVHVGLASTEEPDGNVDFYLDPSARRDRAGVISRVAGKYSTIQVVGDPDWPTSVDLAAMAAAGVEVLGRQVSSVSPGLMAVVEQSHLQDDEIDMRAFESRIVRELKPA